ncbi:hypothetical protein PRIPAC_82116 [Pristionchus pacificus]|uniref:Uncharacterized protein n=1 Tax=Pristionchus pacificus TaxID=54126 RepID=A0A2A6C2K5_PRIPA|nr:hypothetical protein PRIPAC_82116 [Pristionchus pacificus]|eukprot:PDM72404.1 hypothetical protein PRIPAC_38838 [Pristionchus pacificus]
MQYSNLPESIPYEKQKVIHRDAAIVEQDYTKVSHRGVPRFLIDAFDRILKEKTMEGLFWKEGNAARMKSSQDCANLSDAERFRHRRLLVIVKAKFFSDSAEQKIKASGEACVLVAQGTITCVVLIRPSEDMMKALIQLNLSVDPNYMYGAYKADNCMEAMLVKIWTTLPFLCAYSIIIIVFRRIKRTLRAKTNKMNA